LTGRRTLTEHDVRRAARAGTTSLDVAGVVVTPSARDAAKVLGIRLEAPGTDPRPTTGRRAEPSPAEAKVPMTSVKHRARPGTSGSRPAVAMSADGAPGRLIVALGADHGGVALKDAVAARLRELGHTTLDLGTMAADPVDYPDFAVAVARAVADGRAALGIMVDGAGIGSCMAANKIRGVRAAMCYDVTTAANAREHNNATVLTLGGGLIGTRLALAIVETFLATPFAGGRHARRVEKIDALDAGG
jgi:ribose 5-phosphate isomerase B